MGRFGVMITFAAMTLAWPAGPAMSSTYTPPGYWRLNLSLYDGLVRDTSPRQRVLVASQHVPSEVAASRPKREHIVSSTVDLAIDDAFVQWYAAYYGSYCRTCRGPESAIANLTRLEPDNAVGWAFAVTLALGKGDMDGVDHALSRMASATRADDHLMEAFVEWGEAFASGYADASHVVWMDEDPPPEIAAFAFAARKTTKDPSWHAESVAKACRTDTTDPMQELHRLNWCVDAGRTLAGRGNSLELRKLGLSMLEASHEDGESTRRLRRQYAWLAAHDQPPDRHDHHVEAMRVLLELWTGAESHVAIIERDLASREKPLQVPDEWGKSL